MSIFKVKRYVRSVLYAAVLLTFGIADGSTSAFMMGKMGTDSELNPIARYLFLNHGFWAVVGYKVLYTCMILIAVFFIGRLIELKLHKNLYWVVNGILAAFIIGGIAAASSNLIMVSGGNPPAPEEIILMFVFAMFGFMEIGRDLDKNPNP